MKYRTLAAALLLGSVMFTSCVDEFSELNFRSVYYYKA